MQSFDVPGVTAGAAGLDTGTSVPAWSPLTAPPPPEPMRRPRTWRARSVSLQGETAAAAGTDGVSAGALPPVGVIALNRMGFGPRPGDLEAFAALGATDDARLAAYVEQQLNPAAIDDSEVEARLVAGKFTTLDRTHEQLWLDHHVGPPGGPTPDGASRLLPFWETERSTFIRAIYSRRQLAAVLTDFWHNHFNVFGADYWTAPLWVEYDRDVIRANILGNFRTFLDAVATSFPMMLYLDGYGNQAAGPNENFARELFELHGLGAENYLGVRRQDEVPEDANGKPVGYVDDDVYESTRAFTGWGIDFTTGTFKYYSDRHDRFQKFVLGRFLRSDQAPMKDGNDVLDLVAAHPGTARFIARKLCRRFIADDPPQRVVTEVAAVFLAQKDAPDQIRQTVRAVLMSPEFRSTWGQRVKRPFEFVVGAFRATRSELNFELYHQPSEYFMSLFAQAGQSLFRWTTPDGYPDTREKWIGSNAFVGRWRLANWLCEVKNWWDRSYQPFDPFEQMPASVRSARQVVDFWSDRILGRPMSTRARQEAIEFMARGRDPEMEWRGLTDAAIRERVWGTIALILNSPENLFL